MTRFTAIIRTAAPGMSRRARLRRAGSSPAIAPMMRELTASPAHPQVMTKPMAVPLMRGKALPTSASVVGNTGAMAIPARKTSPAATFGFLVRSMRKVVMAMAMEAAIVTAIAETWMRIGETPTRPTSRPRPNPSERILSARVGAMPWATRWRGSQFQTPTSQET